MQQTDWVMADRDVFRFKIMGDEPIELPIRWDTSQPDPKFNIELEVTEAAGCYQYGTTFSFDGIDQFYAGRYAYYEEQVKRINRSEETDKIILYPGVEYITTTWTSTEWVRSAQDPNKFVYDGYREGARLYPNYVEYGNIDFHVDYSRTAEQIGRTTSAEAGQPFPIQRWEDVQNDSELKAYYDGLWEAMPIQNGTFNVCLTDDMSGIPAYHLGGASLHSGRVITPEEYDSGAKVCMVSKQQANLQKWEIGDKLTMNFYAFEAFPNNNNEWYDDQAVWHRETEGFFYSDTYEIVGIYDKSPTTGNSGIARSTLSMPWNTIYIPHNAVENTKPVEELPVHGALLTIWLENGSVDTFLADMEAKGFTKTKEGQYNTAFTFYDQGYSQVRPGLEAMRSTARLLLTLSSVLLAVTVILMAYFFAQSFKQSVGIFRMLGGSKVSAVCALLVCALMVTLAGAAIGGLTGQALAQGVGIEILKDNIARSEMNAIFQAFVLNRDEPIELSVEANALLTVKAACVALAFPAAMLLFVGLYIKKEPRALLPKGEG